MAKVLVIGSGAREHALAVTFQKSAQVTDVFVAPGNAGMQTDGIHTVAIDVLDIAGLTDFAREHQIDLTFVGSEAPLIAGVVDAFMAAGLTIFGPTQAAAQLEGSKTFAKDLLLANQIPTAQARAVDNHAAALAAVEAFGAPIVIKQDGLAAGKGVTIHQTLTAATAALAETYAADEHAKLVIEEFLQGVEFSIFSLVGPNGVVHAPVAQDHKRLLDGDKGPNTGGMGAYSPVRWLAEADIQAAIDQLVTPMLTAMTANNTPYTGVLYTGVMLTAAGPKVIEYNVRFGDPETQVVLPQLESDLYEVVLALLAGQTPAVQWQQDDVYLGVVLATPGYPGPLGERQVVPALQTNALTTFYAGVQANDAKMMSNGGRVATVVAHAKTAHDAQAAVYQAIAATQTALIYRRDIGYQAVNKED